MRLLHLTSQQLTPPNHHHHHRCRCSHHSKIKPNNHPISINLLPITKIINTTFASALSLTLLLNPPLSSTLSPPSPATEDVCREDEAEPPPPMNEGTNEGIVEEAWQIVNDGFLNSATAASRRWSPESWLKKKEDIWSSAITSRSKAHNIIQKMLGSLGDPYTRFLSPEE